MIESYFSPLAPTVILLLSAFILSIIVPRLPARWLSYRAVYYFLPPLLVALAILTAFGLRPGPDRLSTWRFAPTELATMLAVRADGTSLLFMLPSLLLILIMALLTLPLALTLADLRQGQVTPPEIRQWQTLSVWLLIGATACLIFVAANELTLSYAILLFDALLSAYWFQQRRNGAATGRLLLGLLTAALLAATGSADSQAWGLVIGLTLWLRLGLYPWLELAPLSSAKPDTLAYLTLSTAVGIYLVTQMAFQSLPPLIGWLTVILLLLNGFRAWLAEERFTMLIHLTIASSLLILLAVPLNTTITAAYSLGLILSGIALWLTPQVGRPQFDNIRSLWPYLPTLAATLTWLGLPFTLGGTPRLELHQTLLETNSLLVTLLTLLAEALAFSGLIRYWLIDQIDGQDRHQAAFGFVAMTPFLIPGVAPFIISSIAGTQLPAIDSVQLAVEWTMILLIIAGSFGLGYFRDRLLRRLALSARIMSEFLHVSRFTPHFKRWLDMTSKWVLRANVVIEGQHYIGWAIFTAIVGTLIILLRT